MLTTFASMWVRGEAVEAVVEAGDTRGGRGRGLELSVAVLVSVVRGRTGRWKVGGVIWVPGQKLLVR